MYLTWYPEGNEVMQPLINFSDKIDYSSTHRTIIHFPLFFSLFFLTKIFQFQQMQKKKEKKKAIELIFCLAAYLGNSNNMSPNKNLLQMSSNNRRLLELVSLELVKTIYFLLKTKHFYLTQTLVPIEDCWVHCYICNRLDHISTVNHFWTYQLFFQEILTRFQKSLKCFYLLEKCVWWERFSENYKYDLGNHFMISHF